MYRSVFVLKFRPDTSGWTNIKLLISLVLVSLFVSTPISAQSRKELELKRKRLLQEIEQTNEDLEATRQSREATLGQFLALKEQIQKRQQVLTTLEEEIIYTESSISRTNEVLEALTRDIGVLKDEYAQMMRVALRHKLNQSFMVFLFSSNNLNDAFRRWQYIRQYDRYRKRQARLIVDTQQMLRDKATELEARRTEKAALLASTVEQQQTLSQELKSQNSLLTSLKSDERKLITALTKQEKSRQELDNLIEEVIRKEMLAAREKDRTDAGTTEGTTTTSSPATNNLASSFGQQRGLLPWPVESGSISKPFGVHYHPEYKQVKLTNNGIDISTQKGMRVKAVFEGKVVGTQFIPGYKNTVILQHGNYYTVYSNLEEVYVKRGDAVSGGQEIGRVSRVTPEMHFELWRDKERLNPETWVRPAAG